MQLSFIFSNSGNIWAGVFFSRIARAGNYEANRADQYLQTGFGAFFDASGAMLTQPSELRVADSWVFTAPRLSAKPMNLNCDVLNIPVGLTGRRAKVLTTVPLLRLGQNHYRLDGDSCGYATRFIHAAEMGVDPNEWYDLRDVLPAKIWRVIIRRHLPEWFGNPEDGDCWREPVVIGSSYHRGGNRRGGGGSRR